MERPDDLIPHSALFPDGSSNGFEVVYGDPNTGLREFPQLAKVGQSAFNYIGVNRAYEVVLDVDDNPTVRVCHAQKWLDCPPPVHQVHAWRNEALPRHRETMDEVRQPQPMWRPPIAARQR